MQVKSTLNEIDTASLQPVAMQLTPLMRQYRETKEQHPDVLLFFRVGDFYELFEQDAILAARLLDITLTSRPEANYPQGRIPMAGVPVRSVELYVAKLLSKGYSVAICEQVGVVGLEKGPVDRQVSRILTPGTVLESELLPKRESNYLACLVRAKSKNDSKRWGLAYVEASCAEFHVCELSEDELFLELGRLCPSEILAAKRFAKLHPDDAAISEYLDVPDGVAGAYRITGRPENLFQQEASARRIKQFFAVSTFEGYGCENMPLSIEAAGVVLEYLQHTQAAAVPHFSGISVYNAGDQLTLDNNTRKNLELVETLRDRNSVGSLFWVIDQTRTAMGCRLLKKWLLKPLFCVTVIENRQDAISELIASPEMRLCLDKSLTNLADLERLSVRLASAVVNPRDLLAIGDSISRLPELARALLTSKSPYLQALSAVPAQLLELASLIQRSIAADAPREISEGQIFKAGYNQDLDELIGLLGGGKEWLNTFQQEEIKRTGIRNLKVNFNLTFGYYIEISNANRNAVPPEYIRKQTLTNAERYITPALKEHEAKVLNAEKHRHDLEYKLFMELRSTLCEHGGLLHNLAQQIAAIDCLFSLAQVAQSNQYVKPIVDNSLTLSIKSGRHPVLEKILPGGAYVPNDIQLKGESEDGQMIVLTGPNMSGKSSYLRQTALIVILAQMGSFVPAVAAHIGLVDRIFTRIGAVDDLTAGQSTFMVEMTEVTQCCLAASSRSLILFDEVGRGTSTYDGVSIAWSVAEYIATEIRARTIFATHYHELNALSKFFPEIKNCQVLVREQDGQVHFIRSVVPGGASRSFGIQVAKMSGLPATIIERAENLMREMERKSAAHKIVNGPTVKTTSFDEVKQLTLFEAG